MKNLMAKSMTERYADYFRTTNLEERGAKIIYWWVMSAVETFFWGIQRPAQIDAELYASENKMVLVFRASTGEEHELVHYPTYNTSNGKLYKMLENFIEIFNNIEYPVSKDISSPTFLLVDLANVNLQIQNIMDIIK